MPPAGFHAHAAEVTRLPREREPGIITPALKIKFQDRGYEFGSGLTAGPGMTLKVHPMRSLLFVPADSAKKLDKAMTSGADALIVDLEDSIALDGKARARQSAAAFLKEAMATPPRPHLLVRVNGLQTGLTDADLDAVVPAKPDAIMLPKAEGGAAVVHADAKLAVREALSGLPDGHVKIIALATETAAALFLAGTYRGASARLSALTWGAEDLSADIGAKRTATRKVAFSIPIGWRACSASPARLPPKCRRSTPSTSISATTTVFAANAKRRAATALRGSWPFTRRRCRSSTSCSRRRRKPSPTRKRSSMRLPQTPMPASSASAASWSTGRILRARKRLLARSLSPHAGRGLG